MSFSFWREVRLSPLPPQGYNPYDSYEARRRDFARAMTQVWKAICAPSDSKPSFYFIAPWVAERFQLLVDTPPYLIGTEHWWYE